MGEVYVAQPHGVLDLMENVPNMQFDAGMRRDWAAIGSFTAIAVLMYLPFSVKNRLSSLLKPHLDRDIRGGVSSNCPFHSLRTSSLLPRATRMD